jgi:glucans biosynthesis protein C
MTTNLNQKPERQYYIDWLRILLIMSVFLFHIGMVFNTWGWHVKNDQQFSLLNYPMRFLHYWRMPLLFFVSGAGTYFALGIKSTGEYLKERSARLLIPLISGIFILVPVQVYIEKIDSYSSLSNFYLHMFDGVYPEGNFSWHHLWFIAYLFLIALIFSLFIKMFRSNRFNRLIVLAEHFFTKPFSLNLLIIPVLLSQIILRPFFPDETHDLVNDWATIACYFIYFIYGFALIRSSAIKEIIEHQRRSFLIQTLLVTILMFSSPSLIRGDRAAEVVWDISAIVLTWTCSMSAVGYALKYLNKESKFRQLVNEAIYPVYLLHQPVIVVVASIVTRIDVSVALKVYSITLLSLVTTALIYTLLIRPFSFARIIFGMKKKPSSKKEETIKLNIEEFKVKFNIKNLNPETMKTKIENPELPGKGRFVAIGLLLFCLSLNVSAQKSDSVRTLFKPGIKVSEQWTPEVKINSIQGDVGTLIGFYGGSVFNKSFLLGISGGVNLSHPRVNYGYFGAIGQYICKPGNLTHFSVQLLVATGSTKDYEDPKSGLLDNFWNISGASFYMLEPGINLEINLSKRLTFSAGLSYRYVAGLNENNENITVTHVTDRDLSGLNFNIGLKFGKEKKPEK